MKFSVLDMMFYRLDPIQFVDQVELNPDVEAYTNIVGNLGEKKTTRVARVWLSRRGDIILDIHSDYHIGDRNKLISNIQFRRVVKEAVTRLRRYYASKHDGWSDKWLLK